MNVVESEVVSSLARLLMGQVSSRRTDITKRLRENSPSLTDVVLDGVKLSEKDVRKLAEALRHNR